MLQTIADIGLTILVWITVFCCAVAAGAFASRVWRDNKEWSDEYRQMESDALRAKALERELNRRIKQEQKDEQQE